MATGFHKFMVVTGLLALLHAAYSATQHRTYIRLTEQEFTGLPVDILAQCFFGLLVTCYGIVQVAGELREIKATGELENKTWETIGNRPSFYAFNHRGKVLFGRGEA